MVIVLIKRKNSHTGPAFPGFPVKGVDLAILETSSRIVGDTKFFHSMRLRSLEKNSRTLLKKESLSLLVSSRIRVAQVEMKLSLNVSFHIATLPGTDSTEMRSDEETDRRFCRRANISRLLLTYTVSESIIREADA